MLVADVVTTWLERAAGRPTLCFAVDRAHAKDLQQQVPDCRRPGRIHRLLHRGAGTQRHRQALPCRRGEGRLQCRLPDHRHRLGRALHHPGATDQVRNPIRPDDRPRPAHRRRQGRLPDPRPQRQPHPARLRHRHPSRQARRRQTAAASTRGTKRAAAEEMRQVSVPETAEDAAMPVLRVHPGAAAESRAPRRRAGRADIAEHGQERRAPNSSSRSMPS